MWRVTAEYPDYSSFRLKSEIHLNCDQAFNPYTWKAPIHWEGYVGDTKVNFIQISEDAISEDSFDWSGFPEKLEYTKGYIVRAIDDAMRVMD